MGKRRLIGLGAALGFCAIASTSPLHAAGSNEKPTADAAAAQGEPVSVAFSDCESEPLGKAAFLRVLSLELGRRALREGNIDAAAIGVNYRCDGVARVHIVLPPVDVERDVRIDDVPARERARALALAVAELARGGEPAASSSEVHNETSASSAAPASEQEAAAAPDAASKGEKADKAPSRAADKSAEAQPRPPAPLSARSTSPSQSEPRDEADGEATARREVRRTSFLVAGAVRLNLGLSAWSYGAALGLDYVHNLLRIEASGAKTSVARGTITTGVAAVRVGRALPLVNWDPLQVGASVSAAGGLNWAIGNSHVENTHVRNVLMPYADARLSLWATTRTHGAFTPLLEVFGGRAAGIVASADGTVVSGAGGWFAGAELGLWL